MISFDAPAGRLEERRLRRSIETLSGGAVALVSAVVAPDGFDARFSARWRRYRYAVGTAAAADPLRRLSTWELHQRLDLDRMNRAARHLVGTHDFASFCRAPKADPAAVNPPSTVRRVLDAEWFEEEADRLCFEIRATAFCHQLVRSIVGMLVDVGRGRVEADSVPEIVAAKDRARVRTVAPPHGLTLWDVGYDD